MAWNDGLEGNSLHIAASAARRLRVMAGPGAGKSYGMKRRIARLLEEGCAPERILAVTFTRNAAASLVADLRDVGVPGCEDIRAGTLHSFCFGLLGKAQVFAYLNRHPRPLMVFETNPMFQDMKHAGLGTKRVCKKRLEAFEAAWARRQSEEPGWPTDPHDRRFDAYLRAWLRFHKAMHIGEVVPLALDYLRNNPAAEERHTFDHLVVDEFQDLNKAEQELLAVLAADGHLAIVGDENQSIYGFRHAHPEGIVEFSTVHEGTVDFTLDECRRCPRRVVRMADALIRLNHGPEAGPLLAERPANEEGDVRLVQWPSLQSETEGIAEYVRLSIAAGAQPEDFMVLAPSREVGYSIRDRLKTLGIDAHSFYTEEILDNLEAQIAHATVALLAQPDDAAALRFLLGAGMTDYRAPQYARLRELCEARGESPRTVLEQLAARTLTLANVGPLVTRYVETRTRLEALAGLNARELVERLLPDGETWARDAREALLGEVDDEADASKLRDAFTRLASQREMPEEGQFVRVMSLHKAKGLKSRYVIIAACVQGLLPRTAADTEAERDALVEEQRRLFYVGLTRSTDVLVLSSSASWPRKLAYATRLSLAPGRGATARTVASQFLRELGPDAPAPITGDRLLRETVTYARAAATGDDH